MKQVSNGKVDAFFDKATQWEKEMEKLRTILLDCDLTEELKWGKPCYAHEGKNIVIIQGFKDYCAVLFFKGVLLSDPDGILVKTGENTQVGRQARFTNVKEINKVAAVLKAYVYEAIELERAGLKVEVNKENAIPIPAELQDKLAANKKLNKAFQALTPGRQRAYIYYFSSPKQSKTRESRIDKWIPQILEGKGMMD
ncbi:MAG: YdeI/OmpD-associated family protein [Chitinophaga sp.]|uniref:YdeI/OmpD-associated family protein n=1 Tax=Chitinophaga sp. TaxID=1869181 RepID=UPI0025BFD054|nr:YdeI/OmpD-associated family protein [Chitinophaga sp.]MBV8252376.1 YdeI/OmpD-associated family protein [Chitinophaga sp.]